MEHRDVIGYYREYVPHERLREYVRAFFSFVPGRPSIAPGRQVTREILLRAGDSFCSPVFADGNGSIVVELGMICREQCGWRRRATSARAGVIGAMSVVGDTDSQERTEMLGAYFRPAGSSALLHLPASELTDLVVPLPDLWGADGSELPLELDALGESARVDRLESELIRRLAGEGAARSGSGVKVLALATWIAESRGQRSVDQLADAAGVSRQHLTRVFRERVGVTPKLYSRLARFQSGLAYAGLGARVQWSRVAADLGYADQSHMIAEFREFSSLTPQQLGARHWFHPFIERAKSRSGLR
jgi:AraC-like DNA-binding protein